MTTSIQEKPELLHSYRQQEGALRVRYSKAGCVLALLLVPAFGGLDCIVYPHLFWPFLQVRLLCSVGVLGILILLFTSFGLRYIRIISVSWVILPALSITWMIYISEGAASPYYAGLNLVMVAVCLLMPWTIIEVIITCSITLALYFLSCIMHALKTPIAWSMLFNNAYFMVSTAIICILASIYTARRRFEEFRLQYELDIRNKELARSNEQLEELDQLKTEFFANVSHELRTPLTLIISPIQDLLLRKEGISAEVREALSMARHNALRLLKLINDLLDIVRLEAGRAEMNQQSINLSAFIPGLVDSVQHLAQVKHLSLSVQCHETNQRIQGDPDQLEKVFLNLLTNAIKFTPKGGSITIRCTSEDNYVIIEIMDTGIGISDKDLPYIFDRFRQADGSPTRRFQGLGIGLSLAKAIVEEHKGHLTVQSKIGKGTVFRIALPVPENNVSMPEAFTHEAQGKDLLTQVYKAADQTIRVTTDESDIPLSETGTGNFTILVVEDEPDMRQFLVSKLATTYHIIQASDGTTGLDMAKQHMPDLALLDLMIPGMDGLTLCSAIKNDPNMQQVKVILLTARLDEESKISALERGADDFITKPFSTLEVKTRIANLLRTARLEQDLRERNNELENTLIQLKESEANLVQSEKMSALGMLAAGLLHEINNPLNFTLTALHLALNQIGETDVEAKETLEDIHMGMVRIRDIVSDLRSFTRPAGKAESQPFELSEAFQTALNLVAHEVKDFPVIADLQGNDWILGSKTQVTHIFMNLLINSVRAIRKVRIERKPEIRVSSESENEKIHIRVWDNGIGIRETDLPKVFDPFFTTQDVGQGTGLGLSICHTIVKNHNGTIQIKSEEGEWTEVLFDLPLVTKNRQ